MNKLGDFIVLEGIDGSGTTTQAKLLMERFERSGIAAAFTFEPSALPIGRLIRQMLRHELEVEVPQARLLLFAADRFEHIEKQILPALKSGRTVVCDRYDLSSYVYQGDSFPWAGQWLRYISPDVTRPNLTIVLDIDADLAERRRLSRQADIELFEASELQRKYAQRYAAAEQFVHGDHVVHLDGSRSISEVAEGVWGAYEHYVKLKALRLDGPLRPKT